MLVETAGRSVDVAGRAVRQAANSRRVSPQVLGDLGVLLAQRFDVHPNQITEWRRQLVANAADAFATETERRDPAIDVKALHAKIGQQALELDFLANALGRGPGPNGKR